MTDEPFQGAVNLDASTLLDQHHQVQGVSDFNDDVFDSCSLCPFGVGLTEGPDGGTGADIFGHATTATTPQVQHWITTHTPRRWWQRRRR